MSPAINLNSDKQQNTFSTDHLLKDLKAHTVRGTAITTIAQGIKLIIQLISTALLARLLTPEDFGLVAMVTVVTGLLGMFRDGGLSMATIQRQDITHTQITNLFWINVGLGLAIAIFTIVLAPVITKIYDEPRLTWICVAMAAPFLIGGLSLQHEALIRRQMRFKVLAYIDVITLACGVAAGIVSALAGLGYWSLVLMPLTTTVSQTILVWVASDWRPGWLQRGSGVRPLLNFGVNLTGANFIGYIASNTTPFVVGLLGGAPQLGFYNRANTLTAIPSTQILSPVMSVAQPALARVSNDPERFRRAALSLIRKICLLAMFVTVTMVVMADWIVEVFLGPGWAGAVSIFRMLAVFSLVEPVATLATIMLIAAGRADAVFKWKLISFAIISVVLAVGSFWGVSGIVAAYAISGLLVRLPLFLGYASRYLPISKLDFARAMLPYLALAITLMLILVFLRSRFNVESALLGVGIYLPLSAAIYLLGGLLIKNVRLEMLDLYNTMFTLFQVRRS